MLQILQIISEASLTVLRLFKNYHGKRMKRKGCSIIFVNSNAEVLLFLRDNKPGLPYAGMWDILGGHVDPGESPEECIIREMNEEIGYALSDVRLFNVYDFSDRVESVFWRRENFNIDEIVLTEGQCLKWFTRDEAQTTKLAYGFNQVLEDFYSALTNGGPDCVQ